MKRRIQIIITAIFFTIGLYFVGYIETHYHKIMTVKEIDIESHEVFLKDSKGNIWSYYYDQITPEEGNEIDCTMHTMFTDSFYDDEIVDVNVKEK